MDGGMIQFSFNNKNSEYINKELDVRLGKMTAQGLIRSEREYRKVIENMSSKSLNGFGRITDPLMYTVRPHTKVSSAMLTSMFDDIQADLRILYKEVSNGLDILDMSFGRNKSFFRRIKNKISGMWKEIGHFRENSFNLESSDYTFFEGFDAETSSMLVDNLSIDSKKGELLLKSIISNTYNQTEDIQAVDVSIYPPDNKDGGVIYTSLPVNDLTYDYTDGDRDMLRNGLWKTQMITADAPKTVLDPLGRGSTSVYTGVVVYVDITFTNIKLINELGFDPYGEFPINVIGLRYKNTIEGEWVNATITDADGIKRQVTGSSNDWLLFSNINPFHAKSIRLVLHQENYSVVSKLLSSVNTMVDKVVRDIMERRFSKIDYKYRFLNELPRMDSNTDRGTLYDEVMDAIEQEDDINALEDTIGNLLIPKPDEIKADITDWNVYNVGAWSIEPNHVIYPPSALGTYYSHRKESGFKLDEGAPTEVTLYTRQKEPGATFIEWSLMTDNDIEIPIISNNDLWRSEAVKLGVHKALDTAPLRTVIPSNNKSNVIKLDFPVHRDYIREISVFANGEELLDLSDSVLTIEPYNSTEIYFPGIKFKSGDFITVKYVPAVIDTVQCWVIVPESTKNQKMDISNLMVFANKGTADAVSEYLNNTKNLGTANFSISSSYSSKLMLCRKDEYDRWFQDGKVNAFADTILDNTEADMNEIEGSFNITNLKEVIFNITATRLSWLYKNVQSTPYSENGSDNDTWREYVPSPPMMSNVVKHYKKWVGNNAE